MYTNDSDDSELEALKERKMQKFTVTLALDPQSGKVVVDEGEPLINEKDEEKPQALPGEVTQEAKPQEEEEEESDEQIVMKAAQGGIDPDVTMEEFSKRSPATLGEKVRFAMAKKLKEGK